MDYPEFIVRVTSRIPDKGQFMVRYDGLFAKAPRGRSGPAGRLRLRAKGGLSGRRAYLRSIL
jgi:hypothetical protein